MLAIDPDRGSLVETQNVCKHTIVGAEGDIRKTVRRIQVLIYAAKSAFSEAACETCLGLDETIKRIRNLFILSDASPGTNHVAFAGSFSTPPHEDCSRRIRDDQINGNQRCVLYNAAEDGLWTA